MSEIEIKDKKGKATGKHKLAAPLAELKVDPAVMHRVIVAEQSNARQGTHSARTRSEARGGGRKPYKQKKTGRARAGTTRSPIFAHGGMAFAIKPRDYTKKVNRKERRLATIAAFSERAQAGDVILVKEISFKAPKTKEAAELLAGLGLGDTKRVLIVMNEQNENVLKSFKNIPNVEVRMAPSREGKAAAFSTRDILLAHKIVMTEPAMKQTEEVWTK